MRRAQSVAVTAGPPACIPAGTALAANGVPYDGRMPLRTIDDATSQHLAEIAADILELLGPGVELDDLGLEADGPGRVVLRARYRLASAAGESRGQGENVIEAHARLRAAIVEDRIGVALRGLLTPARG